MISQNSISKTSWKYHTVWLSFFLVITALFAACTDNFNEINEDPDAIVHPSPEQLLGFSLYKLGDYQYTEWFYDNYQYIMPMAQQVVPVNGNGADMNRIFDTGSRYWSFYQEIMPNLFAVRKSIESMNEQQAAGYSKLYHLSHVIEVMHGLRVSDVYGSLIYSKSMNGRDSAVFEMPYDSQEELFRIWYEQLNAATEILMEETNYEAVLPGENDFVYQGDYSKWARLANSLKLRLAVRLEHTDREFMQQIIDEATVNEAGFITTMDDQFWWEPAGSYAGTAHDIPNEAVAAAPFLQLLKTNQDPRTLWLFEPNDFDQQQLQQLRDSLLPIPAIIPDTIESIWDRFIGAPVEPDSSGLINYFSVFRDSRNVRLYQLSRLNRFLFAPKENNRQGTYVDVMLSAAEVCFYLSEFIQKGFIPGDARDWYEKGVRFSIRTYYKVAQRADIPLIDSLSLSEDDISWYLLNSDFAWDNRSDNLERIYLQQYINFYKLPNETFALTRRTGIPYKNSDLLKWHPFIAGGQPLTLPRRWPIIPPSVTTNIHYFNQAMNKQGFTVGAVDPVTLNRERVWWDVGD